MHKCVEYCERGGLDQKKLLVVVSVLLPLDNSNLTNNALTTLPQGIFTPLSSLSSLVSRIY